MCPHAIVGIGDPTFLSTQLLIRSQLLLSVTMPENIGFESHKESLKICFNA